MKPELSQGTVPTAVPAGPSRQRGDTRRHRLALMALAGLLAACTATPAPAPHNTVHQVHFACDDGEDIEMRFFPVEGVAVLVRHGQTLELQQQPSASGFRYSNGPNTVRGKGDALRLEIGRRAPIECQAAR